MYIELTPIYYVIIILWFISALVDFVEFTHLWQLKEYRVDRMKDFFSTKQGHQFWKSYPLVTRALLVIGIYVFLHEILSIVYTVVLIFGLDLLFNFYSLCRGKIKRPVITKKILVIILLAFAVESIFILSTHLLPVVLLFLAFRFITLSLVVSLMKYPTLWLKKCYIYQATKKLENYKKLTIIGVTGSYGKTSVKTFLNHILSKKYNVICTPKNINTEIGIAKFILKNSFSDKNIFIVEMGAYRIGEIKLICNMVKPKIGILTAINEQHLSLFRSIQNTQQAKYELLRSLPKNGLAITNSDNKYCREFLQELKSNIQTFGYEEEFKPTLLITETKKTKEGFKFKATIKGQTCQAKVPLPGIHNATNIGACGLVAIHLDMNINEIQEQLKTLKPPKKTMQLYAYGKCTIIDDSYNSNPNGFKAALHYLGGFPSSKKRIIITRGMLELGTKSDQLHRQLGEEIAFCADELVIITKDFEKPLREGILEKYRTNVLLKENSDELLKYVKSLKDTECVILLENRIPDKVYKELVK